MSSTSACAPSKGAAIHFTPPACCAAAKKGEISKLSSLIQQGIHNGKDCQGWSPIHHAAAAGQTAALDLLLKANVSPDTLNRQKNTPLHEAAVMGATGTISLLISANASIEARNYLGNTPLIEAAIFQEYRAIGVLRKNGANPFAKNDLRLTFQDFAQGFPNPVGRLLKEIESHAHSSLKNVY